jgi:hypothetical protein
VEATIFIELAKTETKKLEEIETLAKVVLADM